MIQLGDRVTDRVSGFTGVVVAEYRFLYGCRRVSVQPPVDKDGKLPEQQTFDEPQLVLLQRGVIPVDEPDEDPTSLAKRRIGGPAPYLPSPRPEPRRR